MTVKIKVVGNIPQYARIGDAGCDLVANENAMIGPHSRKLIKTGTWVEIPDGYVGLIHPRSGLALKQGLTVLNTPGTIDSGYRGEIGVILYNSTLDMIEIDRGTRIAQLVFQKFETAEFEIVESLDDSERGVGGFGSTGISS
jgi:dUTP pyrophosphatase